MEMNQARTMYDHQEYEALAAFAQDEAAVASFTEQDYFYVGLALSRRKQYAELLRLYKQMHEQYPTNRGLNDQVCWAIYQLYLKDFDWEKGDQDLFKRQAAFILSQSTDSRYSVKNRVIRMMVEAYKAGKLGQSRNLQEADRYLSMMDPAKLPDTPRVTADGREYASEREQWYSDKIKLMKSMNRWQECYDWAEKGLRAVPKLHHNYDAWWPCSQAVCLRNMGRTQEARAQMEKVVASRFSHWSLWAELFTECDALGDTDAAFRCAIRAVTDRSANDPGMLINFYNDFAAFLMKNGYPEQAMLHRRYSALLREERTWRDRNAHFEWELSPEIAAMDIEQTLARLKPWWQEMAAKGKAWLTGQVERLFAEGGSGIIRGDNGESYYFDARDFTRKNAVPAVGMKVRFTLVDRLDKKKGVVKPNAVEISAAD